MATAAVTYTFAAGGTILAAQHNTNFSDLVTYINTHAIHKDGSIAFTAVPSGPATDPTSDNQLARKAYVDARTLGLLGSDIDTADTANFSTVETTLMEATFTMPTLASPRAVIFVVSLPDIEYVSGAGAVVTLKLTNGANTLYDSWTTSYGSATGAPAHRTVVCVDNAFWTAGAQTVRLRGLTSGATVKIDNAATSRSFLAVIGE